LIDYDQEYSLVAIDGELAVPCNPKSAYAGLNILSEKQGLVPDTFKH